MGAHRPFLPEAPAHRCRQRSEPCIPPACLLGRAAQSEPSAPKEGRGEVNLVLILPRYDSPLQGVGQATLGVDLAVLMETEERLQPLLLSQCRPELEDDVHLIFVRIPSDVRCAGRNHDLLPGTNVALLTAHAEASGAREDLESLLHVGVNVFDRHAPAPLHDVVESQQFAVGVARCLEEDYARRRPGFRSYLLLWPWCSFPCLG
jgi:hypothetical protein